MSKTVPGLLVLMITVVAAGWAGSRYFGPLLIYTGSTNKDQLVLHYEGNVTIIPTVKVSVLVSFGNGTQDWFNDTIVPDTYNFRNVTHFYNFFNVTYSITHGDIVTSWSWYLNSSYVFKIFGEGCEPSNQALCTGYWSLWLWNEQNSCWAYSSLGIDLVLVTRVRMIAWHFLKYDESNPFQGRCS